MKKIIVLLLSVAIIALGTASSFALDPIVSPTAPVYPDTDTEQGSPYAPKTGDAFVEIAMLCAGCGALAVMGVSLNRKLSK